MLLKVGGDASANLTLAQSAIDLRHLSADADLIDLSAVVACVPVQNVV